MSQDPTAPPRRRPLLRYGLYTLVVLAVLGAGGYWWYETAYDRAIRQAYVKHGLDANYGQTLSQRWPRGPWVDYLERMRVPSEAWHAVFAIPEATGHEFYLDENDAGEPELHLVLHLKLKMAFQEWAHQLVATYTTDAAPATVFGGRDLRIPGRRLQHEEALALFDSMVVVRDRWRTENADSLARMMDGLTRVSGVVEETYDREREKIVLRDARSSLSLFEQIPVQFGEMGAAALARCIGDASPSGARVENFGEEPVVLPVGYLCYYILYRRTGFVQEPQPDDSESEWPGTLTMRSDAAALRAARDAWLEELEKDNVYFLGDYQPGRFY